jgi:hypothetical protein
MIDVVLAVLVGVYVWRRPQGPVGIAWLAAAVLASRCLFEAVMTPYYVAPPLMVALLLVSISGGRRFVAASLLAVEISVYAYFHVEPWIWWLPIVGGLAVILVLGYPSTTKPSPEAASEYQSPTSASSPRGLVDRISGRQPELVDHAISI